MTTKISDHNKGDRAALTIGLGEMPNVSRSYEGRCAVGATVPSFHS